MYKPQRCCNPRGPPPPSLTMKVSSSVFTHAVYLPDTIHSSCVQGSSLPTPQPLLSQTDTDGRKHRVHLLRLPKSSQRPCWLLVVAGLAHTLSMLRLWLCMGLLFGGAFVSAAVPVLCGFGVRRVIACGQILEKLWAGTSLWLLLLTNALCFIAPWILGLKNKA